MEADEKPKGCDALAPSVNGNSRVTSDTESFSAPIDEKAPSEIDAPQASYELSGVPLYLLIVGLATAMFLMSLDSSIIATAIPKITSQFNSTRDIGWYGSAYTFAMCALQPISGRMYSSFDMKIMYLIYLAIFEIGSIICAAAINSPMLIIGRAISGAGAAGSFTGAMCIVATVLPLAKRPFYIGILQSTYGFATIIGPLLGGVFTDHATWRWCFWINLPLGAITILAMLFCFHPPPVPAAKDNSVLQRLSHLDFAGALLFIPATIMILLALDWGGTQFPWNSATIIGLFVGGAAVGLIFCVWQIHKADTAMIPPRLIKERTMFSSCSAEFFAMGAMYTSIYYLPEWFQVVKGASPSKSGVMYLPLALADVLAATVTGATLRFVGYPNIYLLLGTAAMSTACGLMSTFTPGSTPKSWIPYQVLQGAGVGMTVSMPYVATQTVLAPEDIAVGTSLLQCFQFLGAAVFLSVSQTVFENKLIYSLSSSGFDQRSIDAIHNAGSAGARSAVPESQLSDVVQAFNFGVTRSFYVGAAVGAVAFVAALGVRWNSVKPPKASSKTSKASEASNARSTADWSGDAA